ncbi:endonuclease/exonuclease/phosphatase family protein [Chryseobacterium sp. JJR-5R]|uniref:endonuclease/exonuclease/phosphatase family protein n=1 Tax=Chryseobacterium sp. JJR-5R TaxID=3093923 RepID=UPI002A7581D6|nr:endonuclease/exonuclease/phosphatase family protein [Chryseobacterium sp. JJR-5R]WPO83971.1 endonuclease/exonuclease/phosphatase family protein [Chryseobacterium sp. JJR-5R]
MKIISWNIARPKVNQHSRIFFIKSIIESEEPDLIVLTETSRCIGFGKAYHELHSETLPALHENQLYEEKENRVSLFSKYPIETQYTTYDPYTSICGNINTDFGPLIMYLSIIGSFGGRNSYFTHDLHCQKEEIKNMKGNICYSGDFNISFSGWKYPSEKVIDETKAFFSQHNLEILTEKNENSAIHIVMNKKFLKDKMVIQHIVSIDRKVSDHHLVSCTIEPINP